MRRRPGWVVSCEHGGHTVPARYRELFAGKERLLASHRGWDPGALTLAKELAQALGAPLIASTTTRLLVDLNRSNGHPSRLGPLVRSLPLSERQRIDRYYYDPYRQRVAQAVERAGGRGDCVIHLSVHSFVSILRGHRRRADIGLLYDPSRSQERMIAGAVAHAVRLHLPGLRVRRNYPYRGAADALVTALRRQYAPSAYAGLELELNQRFVRDPVRFRCVRSALIQAVVAIGR